jgi:hypothetical protein
MTDMGLVPARVRPVNYHGADDVSVVDIDCLFRSARQLDGIPSDLHIW